MREQLVVLDTLRRIDLELSKLEQNLNDYPEKISDFESELETAKARLESLHGENQTLQKNKAGLELEISSNEDLIKKAEQKLFEIKTHKEYEALQKEIADTKRRNAELEDKVLEHMTRLEQVEAEIAAGREDLAAKEAEYGEKINSYKEKLEEIRSLYEPKKEEKEKIASRISPELIPIYKKIGKRNGGVIALAKAEVCTGCNMKIPSQLFNEVLTHTRFIQCPNCQKILYTEDELNSAATPE
ncbi:MAG: hypothetical protein IT344_06310 [Candidatus Dadabacteria bacterium]|nr:hypothetical protein [Candidatus Dadabacteria bacterium]